MTLVADELIKRYGSVRVLRGASFRCEGGEVCALLGANGSGKSTVLGILAGLISPDGGAAELDGESLLGRRAPGRARIGFVPEKANPPSRMTGEQLLALVASLKRAAVPDGARRAALGIDGLLGRPIGGLSLGQRRRLCLAAALIGEPAALLLDEPTNGLDESGARALIELIGASVHRDVAIIIATHDLALVRATGARTLRLEGGRVASVDVAADASAGATD